MKLPLSEYTEFVSVAEAARRLAVCERTVRKRILEGAIPAVRIEGSKAFRIPVCYFDELARIAMARTTLAKSAA